MTGKSERAQPEPGRDPIRQAKNACLRLLTIRSRTRAELRTALARKGFEADAAERVLDRLHDAGLVDDIEFAETWVRSRHVHRGLARRALRTELLRKGVAKNIAERAVRVIDGEAEEDRVRALVRKRLPVLARVEETTAIRRLVSMLARRGYPGGLAYRVVREELGAAWKPASETGPDEAMLSRPSHSRGAKDPDDPAIHHACHFGQPCSGRSSDG